MPQWTRDTTAAQTVRTANTRNNKELSSFLLVVVMVVAVFDSRGGAGGGGAGAGACRRWLLYLIYCGIAHSVV